MKNFKILIVISLIFFTFSCKKENDRIDTYDLGSEIYISNNGYSSLDDQVTFTVNNPVKNLSEVKVIALRIINPDEDILNPPVQDIGTISFSDGVGSITISSANLGITEAGWTADLKFDAVFNGKPFSRYSSITVDNPMSLTSPYIWAPNDDGDLEETSVTVYQNDNVQYIKYDVEPYHATVESTTIETKVGANGTYSDVTGSFDPFKDSLEIIGSNYNANDTVYYRFTSKSGTHEQVGVLNFVVNTIQFPNIGGGTLTATPPNGFDLMNNKVVAAGSDTTDMNFVHVVLTSVGFESVNGTLFVSADESLYDNNDFVEAKKLFDEGTQDTGFANVAAGDVFIYKTSRDGDDFYGIIKINSAYLTTEGSGDYFEFEYRY